MLNIAAIEINAAGRHELVRRLNTLIETAGSSPHLIPPISIRPVAPEEVAFVLAPEVIIAGPILCEESPDSLRRFRSLFPNAYLIGMLNEHTDQLGRAEALASRGVDELMSIFISGVQFMQRIIVLNRSLATSRRGKLILIDGVKGGVGATSVAAGVAEVLAQRGHSVVLVDLDSETQDLSRFLGARPYLNDSLQLILNQQSPLTKENLSQSLVQVGDDSTPFWIVPPVMIPYSTLLPTSPTGKSLLAFLQMIDTEHDYTIIDLAHAGPDLRLSLMRGADKVILVLNGAPSSLHGAAHKIVTTKAIHGDFERLHLIENGVSYSLPHNLLRGEIAKMTGISAEHWIDYQIPNSRSVAYWPGSFSTPASIGCKKTKRALSAVATLITDLKQSDEPQTAQHAFSKISEIVTTKLLPFGRKARTAPHHSGTNKTIHYLPSPEQSRLTDQEAAQPKARHRATSSGEVTG